MITRLVVSNYQRIAHADVELKPLTVIVGANTAGKTSLVRALTALLTNKTGDGFIRHGEKECGVTIEDDRGDSISWKKVRGQGASYAVNAQTHTKMAGSVPPEVTDITQIREVEVDANTSLWPQIHKQGQYGFLVNLSPGTAARAIAKLTRLDIVVKAQQLAKKSIKDLNDELKILEAAKERAQQELKEFDDLESDAALLNTATDIVKELLERNELIAKGRAALYSYNVADKERGIEVPDLKEVSELLEKLVDIDEGVSVLHTLWDGGELNYGLAVPDPKEVEVAREQLDLVSKLHDCFTEYVRVAGVATDAGWDWAEYEVARKSLVEQLATYKVCPVCGGEIEDPSYQ